MRHLPRALISSVLISSALISPALFSPALFSPALIASAEARDPLLAEALAQTEAQFTAIFTSCKDKSGKAHYFVRVVVPPIRENPFAPALTPPGAQKPGYYDLLQYENSDGTHGARVLPTPEQVTIADRQNGIRARYTLAYFIPAYRIYDPRSGTWSDWSSGRAWESEKIEVVSYTTTKRDDRWESVPRFNIMTNGAFEKPTCSEIP